jgi:hypothetical protein
LPPETGPKGGADRGRTEERVGKSAPRTARGSPWRDKCSAGLTCKGIDDGSCALWHPAKRSPSATPSPSRDSRYLSASSDGVSEMVRKAGFNKHFKGYVHVAPPPEQANLATAKEAGPQRSVRFRDVPDEICLVPESLGPVRSLAASETPASSCMRKGQSDKFLSHPELPECILTRTQTREFAADFADRNVTSEWLKLSEHDRRRSVIRGFHWPTLLNAFIASCLYHRIPVTAPVRNAWEPVWRPKFPG